MVAPADGKPQTVHRRARRRRRPGPPRLAHFVARAEPVPVLASRLEPADLDMDAVTQLGPSERTALLSDGLEPCIARDLPVDVDVHHGHAPALERFRRQSRPQHDAVRQRIAGSDAHRERIGVEDRFRNETPRYQRRRNGGGAEQPPQPHQLPAGQPCQCAVV